LKLELFSKRTQPRPGLRKPDVNLSYRRIEFTYASCIGTVTVKKEYVGILRNLRSGVSLARTV
jgi:hypothetical protein